MSTLRDLHVAVLNRLAVLSDLTVYDGEVPPNIPADASGRVDTYAVVWFTPGSVPDAARNLEHDPQGGLTWDARVTVAGGRKWDVIDAIGTVRSRLEGWRPVPGSLLAEVDTGGTTVQRDPDTSPPRWFVPLQFRTNL